MPGPGFSRDEVILALDVLYSSGEKVADEKSAAMQELSALLNKLPIHAVSKRHARFRNPKGVARQINCFRVSAKKGTRSTDVGANFFDIAEEFRDNREELHRIATAIRRNADAFDELLFGDPKEGAGFPEGALLGHLHCLLEARDSANLPMEERCAICGIQTTDIYPDCPNLMALHLTAPITALDAKKRYEAKEFITVCPNCHAALHRRRPWLTKEHCNENELLK